MSQLRDEDGKRQKRPLSDTGMATEGLLPVQSLNEGTGRAFARGAARHRLAEYPLHLFQVGDFGAYILEMSCGKTPRLGARTLAMVSQGQQGPAKRSEPDSILSLPHHRKIRLESVAATDFIILTQRERKERRTC